MADEKADNPTETPLFRLIQEEWPEIEQEIKTVQVLEGDFLLYVLWALDSVKEGEKDFASKMWAKTYSSLRKHFITRNFTSPENDLEYLTAQVCAFTLYCTGLLIAGDTGNMAVYGDMVNGLEKHWPEVKTFKHKLSTHPAIPGLKEWLYAYMNNEVFYTVSDKMDWDTEIGCALPVLTTPAWANPNIGQVNIANFNNYPGATFVDNSTNTRNSNTNQNPKEQQYGQHRNIQ